MSNRCIHAKNFAIRLQAEAPAHSDIEFRGSVPEEARASAEVAYAWQLAYGRPPAATELEFSLEFLTRQIDYIENAGTAKAKENPSLQAMTNLCQVLLSSNEFLYVD